MNTCRARVVVLGAMVALTASSCSGAPVPDDGSLPFDTTTTSDE